MLRFLYILIIVLPLIGHGQENVVPVSGVYTNEVVITAPENTQLYYAKYAYKDKSDFKNITNKLVIKEAACLKFKLKSSDFDTTFYRTYLFQDTSKLPLLLVVIDPENLWNDTTGIYVRGKYAYFNDSTGHWENCNYQKKWEKDAFSTYLDTNREILFEQHCGLKLFGESTRRQPDKSFKLIARTEYGKNRFEGKLFPHKDLTSFKQLAVRTSGNDYNKNRFKDVLSAKTALPLNIDYMDYQPVQLYVNGIKWGVYNLREKVNEHFISGNYKVAPDSVNIIMGRWVRQEGSVKPYLDMYYWFMDLDTMNQSAYKKASEFLDLRNYINYRVFQIYINNKDSRGNIRYFNINGVQPKFKMILYDTDLGWGKYNMNYLKGCLSTTRTHWYNPEWSTVYLTKLMQEPKFKEQFIIQFAHQLNTTLHKDTILEHIDELQAIYENELPNSKKDRPPHLKKLVFYRNAWLTHVNSLRSYAKLRPKAMWDHLQEVFQLAPPKVVMVKSDSAWIEINNNNAVVGKFSGKYFSEFPLKLVALDHLDLEFSHWQDGDTSRGKVFTITQDTLLIKPFYKTKAEPKELGDEELSVEDEKGILNTNSKAKMSKQLLWYIAFTCFGFSLLFFILYFTVPKKH